MEIDEKSQKGGVENGIETPTQESGATRPGKMVIQHHTGDHEAEDELYNLTVGDQNLPPWTPPECAQQVVCVH